MDEFKYLGVLFTSEREIDICIWVVSAVMWTLKLSVVVKRKLSHNAKLSIHQSV